MDKPIQFQERLIEEVVAESDAEIETLIRELDRNGDSTIERREVTDGNDSLVLNGVTQSWSTDQYERVEQLLLEKGLIGERRASVPSPVKHFGAFNPWNLGNEGGFRYPYDHTGFHTNLDGLRIYSTAYSTLLSSDYGEFLRKHACITAGEKDMVRICGNPFGHGDWFVSVDLFQAVEMLYPQHEDKL